MLLFRRYLIAFEVLSSKDQILPSINLSDTDVVKQKKFIKTIRFTWSAEKILFFFHWKTQSSNLMEPKIDVSHTSLFSIKFQI